MTSVRIHCPTCEAAYEGSSAAQLRCGRCGLLFDAKAAPVAPPPPVQGQKTGWVPPPPTVIYLSSGETGATADPSSVVPTYQPKAPGPRQEAVSEAKLEPPGPPPPYCPIAAPPRRAPRRAATEEVPPVMPVDPRLIDTLGPPPPYHPIVGGGPMFERGPAPDLEPWREGAPIRVPASEDADKRADADPGEPAWVLNREAELADARGSEPPPETRFEPLPDYGPRDRPVAPPGVAGASRPGPRARSRPRAIRPMIWAAAIGAAVLMVGVAFDAGRGRVMRAFPGTTGIYTSLGLADAPAAACVETKSPDRSGPPELRDAICRDEQPAAPTK